MKRPTSRRDLMRDLMHKHRHDSTAIIRDYAKAEIDGIVSRRSNTYETSPEDYAARLYADGIKKGWIHE
jgi:hypothetical protein